jgi:exodeoxyribonuclease V alpha subunit
MTAELDRYDGRIAARASGALAAFNEIGLLSAADVHVAARLVALVSEGADDVALAAALAVRGPRLGHVFVDLASIRETASVESEEPVDLSTLPWPAADEWLAAVEDSALVAVGEAGDAPDDRPLRLLGSRLYLDRYWREERRVAADLHALSGGVLPDLDLGILAAGVARLFGDGSDARQRVAAAAAVLRRFAVLAGGPGTGKTTTVARIVALLAEQAAARGERPPLIALAAPTGKAAARLQEAVGGEAARLSVSDEVRELLLGLRASTLHRLLGWRPGSHSRFAHDRENRLAHDVVIVDETSMISLWQMARLVEAVRSDARLILVGDPGQLTSIEAGVVLGDIVGPAAEGLRMSAGARARLAEVTGVEVAGEVEAAAGVGVQAGVEAAAGVEVQAGVEAAAGAGAREAGGIGDGIVVLERVYRYGGGIAELADAIRAGDGDRAVRALTDGGEEIAWLREEQADPRILREHTIASGRAVIEAARAGDGAAALTALAGFRLLCAHRRGPHGVSVWASRQQAWLAEAVGELDVEQRDYVGRPLLVTENDYELGLYNGDTGVVVAGPGGRPTAAFERGGALVHVSPLRLGAVETVYAMTIHKSQGSQFGTAAVLLPPASSQILTRELLYTAVTRARARLILIGGEQSVRAAVARPVSRASGLRARLWGE